MIQVVADIRHFTLMQNLIVYSDGDIIETVMAPLENVVDSIYGLTSKYSATEVKMIGNKDYLKKFKEDLGTKFSNLNIEIIER